MTDSESLAAVDENQLSQFAFQFLKQNKKDLVIEKFCGKKELAEVANPRTIMMAGCTGAGKTEFSRSLISKEGEIFQKIRERKFPGYAIADADEIYLLLCQHLSLENLDCRDDLTQATIKGVEIIADTALKRKQNLLIDSSFSTDKSFTNITRSLGKGRKVTIHYIYEDIKTAWYYVERRRQKEQRSVTPEFFARTYIGSYEMMREVKKRFGDKVQLDLWNKEIGKNTDETLLSPAFSKRETNIDNIDNYIKLEYNTVESVIDIINNL